MRFVVIIVSLLVSICWANAKSGRSSDSPSDKKMKTFKSNLGYEIKYPDCMKVENADPTDIESDIKDSDITISMDSSKTCKFEQGQAILNITKYPSLRENETIEDVIKLKEKGAKLNKQAGGENFLLVKKDVSPKIIYIESSEWHNRYIRTKALTNCGRNVFTFSFDRDIKDYNFDIVKALKSGKPSIPKIETAIIDSFKCDKPK